MAYSRVSNGMSKAVQTYVVAVSGGVDSVVLLDMLVNRSQLLTSSYQLPAINYQLVVAHVDHGMRPNSADDAIFVQQLAEKYKLVFENYQEKLGQGASEATAREARYEYLRQCCKKHNASTIITAHHQDDAIETALLNLLRGTGWRGLASLRTDSAHGETKILRPLLSMTKQEIIEYARGNNLAWREDETNHDQDYLRNYIRYSLLPKAQNKNADFKTELLKSIHAVQSLRPKIELELAGLAGVYQRSSLAYEVPRYQLLMWPSEVAHEVIYTIFRCIDVAWHPDQYQVKRALHFCKTGQPGKKILVNKSIEVQATKVGLCFQRR